MRARRLPRLPLAFGLSFLIGPNMPAGHKPAGFGSGGAAVTKVSLLHGISTTPSVPSFPGHPGDDQV